MCGHARIAMIVDQSGEHRVSHVRTKRRIRLRIVGAIKTEFVWNQNGIKSRENSSPSRTAGAVYAQYKSRQPTRDEVNKHIRSSEKETIMVHAHRK